MDNIHNQSAFFARPPDFYKNLILGSVLFILAVLALLNFSIIGVFGWPQYFYLVSLALLLIVLIASVYLLFRYNNKKSVYAYLVIGIYSFSIAVGLFGIFMYSYLLLIFDIELRNTIRFEAVLTFITIIGAVISLYYAKRNLEISSDDPTEKTILLEIQYFRDQLDKYYSPLYQESETIRTNIEKLTKDSDDENISSEIFAIHNSLFSMLDTVNRYGKLDSENTVPDVLNFVETAKAFAEGAAYVSRKELKNEAKVLLKSENLILRKLPVSIYKIQYTILKRNQESEEKSKDETEEKSKSETEEKSKSETEEKSKSETKD